MSTNREICFVIMPFNKTTDKHTEDYWTKHFERFLKPLIEENPDLEARRSEALRGDILRQIITDLVVSRVVVADLTDHNPNVYWELGVRQSFKHGTVTIAEGGTPLPFDIGAKGTLFYYPGNHLKNADFCESFKQAIQDCLQHPDRADSHVLETLSGRGTLFEIFHRDEARRRLDALISECYGNLEVVKAAVSRARDNQEGKKRSVITSRFRGSAVELLITNRYVDEPQTFFESAEEYLDDISMWNGQLNAWESHPVPTEKWLLKQGEAMEKLIETCTAKAKAAREKLSKRF